MAREPKTMAVAHSPKEWRAHFSPASAPPTAVTIGNFDGVHLGHQAILRALLEYARRKSLLAAVVTFDPHPLRVVRPEHAPPMLMTLSQRLRCLAGFGVDAALVLKFDLALSHLSPAEFVRRILAETLAAKGILVGENFRFGHRHAGDVALLAEMGRTGSCGARFDVITVPPVIFRGVVVSSTLVRNSLREGQVSHAARLLGRPYELEGKIQSGRGVGRKVVVPTLNLATEAELLPANGVYATQTHVRGKWQPSVTNIGVRPTMSADGGPAPVSVESHLLGFAEDVTEGPLAVRFCARLRDERKFPGPDALWAQIQRDIARATRLFRTLDSKQIGKRPRGTNRLRPK